MGFGSVQTLGDPRAMYEGHVVLHAPCRFVDAAQDVQAGLTRYRVAVLSAKIGGRVKWLKWQLEVGGRVQ